MADVLITRGGQHIAPGHLGRGPVKVARPVGKPARGPAQPSNPYGVPNQLYQQALGLTNAQTAGPLAELAKQLAQNDQNTQAQTRLAGSYFNQFGDLAKTGAQNAQNIAGGLNTTLSGLAGQENAALQQSGQGQLDALSKYTPPGANDSLGVQALQAQLAREQGLAAQNQGAFQSTGATLGSNAAQLANSNLGVGALAGTQALKGISQAGELANAKPLAQEAALQAQRGALLATNINKIGQQNVSNQIAEAGVLTKQQQIQLNAALGQGRLANQLYGINSANSRNAAGINAANSRSANSIAAANARNAATIAGENARNARNNATRSAIAAANRAAKTGSGAVKPLTPNEQNRVYNSFGTISALIKEGQQAGLPEQQIRQLLENGGPKGHLTKYPPVYVQAVYELLGWGHITPGVAAQLHAQGLRRGYFNGKPIKVGPPPAGMPHNKGWAAQLGAFLNNPTGR